MLSELSGMRSVACAFGVGLVALVGTTSPAWADGATFDSHVSCSDGGCNVEANSPGASEAPRGGGGGAPAENSAPESDQMPDELPCTYADATLHSSGRQGPLPLTLGTAACDDTTTTLGGDPGDGETVFDPALLAEQARAAMDLPAPSIGTAPPVGAPRFVQIPSWMWIDARDWSPVSATASVGAGSVTVSATPQQITWDTGDGNEVVCQAPGTVFSPDLHSDQGSPDCGHTYTSLPSGGAGAPIDLTADWEWDVTWSTTDGQGGGLAPLTTYSSVTVTVSEIHAVVTDVG